MLTISRLDEQSISTFLLLVQPGLRGLVWQNRSDQTQIVLGATFWGQSVGVAVGCVDETAPHLVDLYVLPDYRRAGIGRALLAALEEAMAQTGLCQIQVFYRPNESTPIFESLLTKRGWIQPALHHIVFWTTKELDAVNLAWMQRYQFRPPYEVVVWHDITEAERLRVAEQGKQGWYPDLLSPFTRPDAAWDPETSLALRYKNEIVGWVLTVREAPLQLLIDILFVDPPLQRLGKGFMLIGEVTRRCWQIGMEDMYWRASPDNEAMLRWSRRAFENTLAHEYEMWYSEKKLSMP